MISPSEAYRKLVNEMGSYRPPKGSPLTTSEGERIPYRQGRVYVDWYLGRKLKQDYDPQNLDNWMNMQERKRMSRPAKQAGGVFRKWFLDRGLAENFRVALEIVNGERVAAETRSECQFGLGQNDDQSQWPFAFKMGHENLLSLAIDEKYQQLGRHETADDQGSVLECLETLASLEAERGSWELAIRHRKQIVSIYEALQEPFRAACSRNELALAQFNHWSWDDVDENLRKCLLIWKQLGNPLTPQRCDTHDYLAVNMRAIARSEGSDKNLNTAIKMLNESRVWREEMQSPVGLASTSHRLGHVFAQKAFIAHRDGKTSVLKTSLQQGEDALVEAQTIRARAGFKLDLCRTLNTYASLLVSGASETRTDDIRLKLRESQQLATLHNFGEGWYRAMLIAARLEEKLRRVDALTKLLDEIESNRQGFRPSIVSEARYCRYREVVARARNRPDEAKKWDRKREEIERKLPVTGKRKVP